MLNTPDIQAMWEMTAGMLPADTQRFLEQFHAEAGDPDPVATTQAFATRHPLLKAWGEFQQTHPVIVAPICTELPFKAGTDRSENRVAAEIHSLRMTTAVNALGLPAVALPVGVADGLPQVVQVIGPRYREHLRLDAGRRAAAHRKSTDRRIRQVSVATTARVGPAMTPVLAKSASPDAP